MSQLVTTLLLCLLAAQAAAQTAQKPPLTTEQNVCVNAVQADYNKRNLALSERGNPLPSITSVETTLAIRRLEEDFCLRSTRCILDEKNKVDFAVAFSRCLEDEALEKYDALPREETDKD